MEKMDDARELIKQSLDDEKTRHVFADTIGNAFIAAQIRELREDRKLSQEQLAAIIGTKQSGISRLERADYSAWKVETLRKLATAFGVRLRIRFEEFGTVLDDLTEFDDAHLRPKPYRQDPVFNPVKKRPAKARKKA